MHISIAHLLTHYILNTFILIGRRNEPHPPLNYRMGGDLRVLFSCILHHCMNRVMVSLKIVSLFICLEKSSPKEVLFGHLGSIYMVNNLSEWKITIHPQR